MTDPAGTTAVVLERPGCDICQDETEAHYDIATIQGPWAFVCELHFQLLSPRHELGLGIGQRLLTPDEVARRAVQ